jgi:hypothetical protein
MIDAKLRKKSLFIKKRKTLVKISLPVLVLSVSYVEVMRLKYNTDKNINREEEKTTIVCLRYLKVSVEILY